MLKRALPVLALVGLVSAIAIGQVRRNGKLPIGSPDTNVQILGNLELGKPIFPTDTTLGVVIDGGLTVVGAEKHLGVSTLSVIDAGVLCVQGGCMTRLLGFTTAAIDFASTTTTCTDSAATTVTGAQTTDTCVLGMPSTLTAGGTGLNGTYTCYVSATNNVKIRHCAAGSADDPGSVTFTGFVISGL